MQLVATGLTKPRSIEFDTNGNLLVVQQGVGVSNIAFKDNGGTCLEVDTTADVIKNTAVSWAPWRLKSQFLMIVNS